MVDADHQFPLLNSLQFGCNHILPQSVEQVINIEIGSVSFSRIGIFKCDFSPVSLFRGVARLRKSVVFRTIYKRDNDEI